MKKGKIRKGICLICGCIVLSACTIEKEEDSAILYKKGLEVIQKMDQMAECKEYIELVASVSQLEDMIEEIGEKDYTKPDAVYQITISEEAMQTVLSLASETDLKLPEEILPDMYRRFLAAVPASLNSMEGTAALAVTSMLMTDTDFLYKDLTERTMYLYLYQNAYPVIVLFLPMDQGIVRAQGQFILNERFVWDLSEETIVHLLEGVGYFSGCEIQKIEIQ